MSNYAINIRPNAAAGTSSSIAVSGVPYNASTILYNDPSVFYGGFLNIFGPTHPSIISIGDPYSVGTTTHGTVILYAGMPMGLLLDLTYSTSATITF